MPKIKAAVAHEFGKPLKVEDVILRSPVNNEVEVTLGAVAICHSDISFMEGAWGGFLPAVYGHEASGKISNIGDNVEGLAIGDRVVVTLIRSCGNCTNCKQGQPKFKSFVLFRQSNNQLLVELLLNMGFRKVSPKLRRLSRQFALGCQL